MSTKCQAVLAVSLTLAVSGVLAQTQPTLTIGFDRGFDAVGRQGTIPGKPLDAPLLAPGKSGQALKSGPGTGYVEYPTAGILNPAAGTVEMWVCPLDWKPADEEFHVFFEARGEGALYLYKYYQGIRLLMLACENVSGPYFSSSADLKWKPGEWHHIAGVWSADGVMGYVDGKPAGKMPVEARLPRSVGTTFRIGDHPWHLKRTSSSLIDDVCVYDRALTAAHIAAHHQGNYGFSAPLTPESIVLRHAIDPDKNTVQVHLSTGADVDYSRLRARLAMVSEGAPLPEVTPPLPFADGRVVHALPLPSTQPGSYELLAAVELDGKPLTLLRRDVIIPTTEWRGNTLGMEDRVLPPWTPLEVEEDTVRCWGRAYACQRAALPTQITSAGQDLLARPISLSLAMDGKPVAWETVTPRETRLLSRTRIDSVRGLAGTSNGKAVRVDVRATVEYDGVMLLDFRLVQGDAGAVETLALEVPLRAERAIYRHRWARSWEGVTGNLPEGQGIVDKETYIPYYWLGDNDRGLFWFCESDEMWPNGQSPNAIEVVRSGGEVVLRLNLLAQGQKLPPDWRFACGLQATPVKPIPKDWRKWRLDPGRNANVSILWPTPDRNSIRHFGYPEAADAAAFTQRIAAIHSKGIKAVPYLCLTFLSTGCPEWPFFQKRWGMGPVDTACGDVAAYGVGFAMVSPVGEGFEDFIIAKNKCFIDRFGIDGLYHDNTHPYGSSERDAGLGYERGGKRCPTYPILAYRALYRRMYGVIKGAPRETFTMAHMSGKVTIPILAYDDSYLDGEHFRGRVKDTYMDVLSLDTFRTEFMGRQWGIMPFFLPEFDAEYAKQVEPTRGLMALLMIHDVSPWPIWCNAAVMNEALAALDEFGHVDSEFLPYFDAVPPATTEMTDIYVSAYKRADGRALLIAANLSKEDRQGTVRINAERIGVSIGKLMSWPDKQPLAADNGQVRLDVPKLSYRMVIVEKF